MTEDDRPTKSVLTEKGIVTAQRFVSNIAFGPEWVRAMKRLGIGDGYWELIANFVHWHSGTAVLALVDAHRLLFYCAEELKVEQSSVSLAQLVAYAEKLGLKRPGLASIATLRVSKLFQPGLDKAAITTNFACSDTIAYIKDREEPSFEFMCISLDQPLSADVQWLLFST